MQYKYSKQREAVYSVLLKKNYHPSVDEVYSLVREKIPNISLATVYRNVEQLCAMGKVVAIKCGDGPVRYDGNPERHYHIKCLSCGKMEDVWLDDELREINSKKDKLVGFTSVDCEVFFTGICDECSAKDKELE